MAIKNQNISDELVETYILHNDFEFKHGEITNAPVDIFGIGQIL